MADIKTVYDDMAGKLGIKRSSCRTVYQDHRREKKRQAREAEMEAQERDDLDRLRDAVGLAGTPLGDAADPLGRDPERGSDGRTIDAPPP